MKLKKLLKDIPADSIKGSKEIEITGICANSKLVSPGNLFIARKGKSDHGRRYIPEAIAGGAVAILTDLYDPFLKGIVQIVHPDIARLEALLAARCYDFPSHRLFAVGITGTNGKTTTAFLVKHLLDHFNGSCGLIGTVEYIIGEHRHKATRTTPDVAQNHKMLHEMILEGCKSVVMEVTSHALDQGRVTHIDFDAAVFTNLTQDHLDYHQTMEKYFEAKQKLFLQNPLEESHKKKKTAILNADSPWTEKLISHGSSTITYGINSNASLKASGISYCQSETVFTVEWEGKKQEVVFPLSGRFNVYNWLAAASVGLSWGASLEKIIEVLQQVPPVVGRLERVKNPLNLQIYVDFAHTEDALINVFDCLKEINQGKMIVVFGCGGDRDPGKRAKMAAACENHADFCIVTSDNPRSEDPISICNQICKGFKKKDSYKVIIDRKEAIAEAIKIANPKDIVLIAGKGHETTQIFAHKTIEFDDRKIALQVCEEKANKAL